MDHNLDPQLTRTSMEFWRKVVDKKIPASNILKVHLMCHLASNLSYVFKVWQSWTTAFGLYKPTNVQDQIEFGALKAEITNFVAWTKSNLDNLKAMGEQKVHTDSGQDLLSGQEFRPAIRSLLNWIRKQKPANGNGQVATGV